MGMAAWCRWGAVVCLALCSSASMTAARTHGSAEDAPLDSYGRPLNDALGPLNYRAQGDEWFVRRADGSFSITSRPGAAQTPAGSEAFSTFHLNPYTASAVGSWPEAVAIGDVTGDGRPDVVLTTTFYFSPVNDYCVFVFAQQSNGTLGVPVRYSYLQTAGQTGLVLADLDEDGVRDVIVGHDTGITVLLADGHGGLRPGLVTADSDARSLVSTDVDRDGHVDIVSLGWSRGATIFHGDGHGGFSRKRALATNASGYNDEEVDDLTGDGLPDLAVMSGQTYATPSLTVHRHSATTDYLSPPAAYFMGSNETTRGLGLGDVTGDGLVDAVLSRPRNSPTWLWIMSQGGAGGMSGPTTIQSYDIPEAVEVADMDGDGMEDVVVLHGGWNAIGVYLQRAGLGLGAELLFQVPYASHYVGQGLAIGDFTSDGCPDVAIADYNHGLVTMTGAGCVAPTPVQISLVSANATPNQVRLEWYTADNSLAQVSVYRRTRDTGWAKTGTVWTEGNGMLAYVDTDVSPGTRYGFRLGIGGAGAERYVGETWVDVPAREELALAGFLTNPSPGMASAVFSLPDAAPTRLELFDVVGRRIETREVGMLGPGSHVLGLSEGRPLEPGVYLLRLSRAAHSLAVRGVVVR